MKKYFTTLFILLSLSTLSSYAFADDELVKFSNLFSFGDSLTDTGNIGGSPFTNRNADGSASLWINDLGNSLGLGVTPSNNGGTNYAQAGGITGTLPFGLTGSHPNEQLQIQGYLNSAGGAADPNALYTVWAGGNDLVDGLLGFLSNDQMLVLSQASVANTVGNVTALLNAGAKYIIVPNIPDFSRSPMLQALFSGNPAGLAALSQLVQAYNTQLLASLNATGKDIIQIDAAGALNAIQDNFAKFGFVGAESETCNFLSMVKCSSSDPNQDIFFSDGFHPSQETHKIMGDYVLSVLEGPELASYLAETPLSVMNGENKQIQSELLSIQSGLTELAVNKWHVFGAGIYNTTHRDSNGPIDHGYHQEATAILAGLDYRLNPQILLGFAVGRSMGKIDYSSDSTSYSFDLDENMANLFGGYQFWNQQAYVNASLGYGAINDSNIHRSFMLGILPETVSGNTTGDHYDALVNLGYNFSLMQHQVLTGPIASLEYQRVDVRPYAESSSNFEVNNAAFDALQYGEQYYDSCVGALGWQLSYTGKIHNVKVMPFIQATYNHEFIDSNTVTAGVTSLPGSHFSLPVGLPFQDFGVFTGGVQSVLNNGLIVSVGYNAMAAHRYLSQNVMLNFSMPL